MASAGTVTLELDANSVKLIRELQKAQKQTKKSGQGMQRSMADSLKKIRDGLNATAKSFAAISVAAAATAAAVYRSTSSNIRQINQLSQVANTNVQDFTRMAYAAQTVGIEQEKLSDILKDMSDRVGDFLQTGGGPMRDFFEQIAPRVGVTAEQFRNLSGRDALQLYVDTLEKANLSQNEMVFYMETIASDSTKLLPLLRNNGEAMGRMADEADDLGLSLSNLDVAQVELANIEMQRISGIVRGIAQQFTVDLSPVVVAFSKEIISARKEVGNFGDVIVNTLEVIALGFGYAGNALYGWRLIVKSIELAMAGFGALVFKIASAIERTFENMVNGAIDSINKLILATDRIGLNIDLIPLVTFDKDGKNLKYLAALEANVKKLQVDLENLALESMPTENIRAFFDTIRDGIRTSREEAAQGAIALPQASNAEAGVGGTTDLTDEERKLNSIISSTRTQVEMLKEQIALVKSAIESGITAPFEALGTTGEEVLKRLENRLGEMSATGKEKFIDLAEMGKQAARGIHSAFVDFLMNPFEEGLKGMLKAFLNMLQRMIAEVVAAQMLRQLFGGLAGSANGFLSSIGEAFGGVPVGGTRDVGGRGEPGKAYVINPKAGPEMFVPSTAGEFIPNIDEKMGGGTNLSLTIDARDAGAEARIKDMIVREMVPQIISAAKSDTLNTLRRPRFA